MAGGGSRYRFELTRLEVAGVIVSSAASLFIVFLLGVYAGGGLGARGMADEERVVRLPAAPVEKAGETEPALDDLLGKDRPPAAQARPADTGGTEEKHEAAVADAAPLAVPAESGDRVAAAPEAAKEKDAGAVAPGEERSGGAPDPSTRADAQVAAITSSATPAPRAPEARVAVALAPSAAASAPPSQRGPWSVQVTATLDRRTADDMVRRLRAKGFDAYVVKAPRQGKTYYRVRVGRFPSSEYASQMVSRLRREPGVPEAFVASD